MTADEARSWCRSRGISVSSRRYLSYAEATHCFSINIEDKPSRLIALANYLVPTWDEASFQGGVLWIRERGIWDEQSESTGEAILRKMRFANGENEPTEKTPAQFFTREELRDMHAYFAIPLLFGWDAFLIPDGKDFFIFTSHDGIIEVVNRTREALGELLERTSDWNPQEDRRWYPEFARE